VTGLLQATSEQESLFTGLPQLLTKGLDKVMTIFKHRDPNFYAACVAALEITNN
tara:strand:+ start:3261 stop:3422 length:162 start_codon:yes stop_codon:yes gene_type:complete